MSADEPVAGSDLAPDPSPDPWAALARLTPARIGLGRAGSALPTREVLRFGLAHAMARDAVHAPFEAEAVALAVEALGFTTVRVESRADGRESYLRRPDLGRRLSARSCEALAGSVAPEAAPDLAVVVADGLSATAVHRNAAPCLAALKPRLDREGWRVGTVAVAAQARVALGDEVGALLGAALVLVLIGERPGLSSPDSLGAYLTLGPRVGRSDAERNCVSNIRAEGLSAEAAAFKLAWLAREARRAGATGVALKDASDRELALTVQTPTRLPSPEGAG